MRRKEIPAISEDIIYHIFSYLTGFALIKVSLVCQTWNKISKDEKFWKELFERKGWKLPSSKQQNFSEDLSMQRKLTTHRAYFMKAHRVHINNWQPNEENAPATKKKIVDVFKKKKETQVLLMGLDGVGKTVALYQLKMGEPIDSVPTVGTIEEQVKYQKMTFNIVEIGGHKMMHQVWKQYLANTDAVLWMVNAGDKIKLAESREELHEIDEILYQISRPALLGVLINKNDVSGAVTPHQLIEELDLENLDFKAKYVQSVSPTTGSRELWIMIDWIYTHLPKLKKSKEKS